MARTRVLWSVAIAGPWLCAFACTPGAAPIGQVGSGGQANAGGNGATQSGGSANGSSGTSGAGNSSGGGGLPGTGGGNPNAGTGAVAVGGNGNAGGSGGTGGADVRGPTPPQPGVNFPFPQNRYSANCTYPASFRNSDVIAAYDRWKRETVTTNGAGGFVRVQRLATDPGLELNSTVSEGIAYGMMIAVYMNDQALFDGLWKYSQLWLNPRTGLMHWYINAAGTEVLGEGAASDADEDMAWALVMADRQWGGSGTLGDTYLNTARGLIDRMWQYEILEGKLLKPGDEWGDTWEVVNVSYFSPAYYRVFAQVSGNTGWNDVVVTSYDTLENTLNAANGNMTNGLVPAWCTSEGVPSPGFEGAPTHYQYDSCRTPFRIGLDYCLFNEPRARDYVAKTSQFFAQIGAANIVDGYDLNGAPRPQFPGQSAAFVGPAAVGAMSNASHLPFLEATYSLVATGNLQAGGAYYDQSWTVLSLLMLTGNFLDYTKH